MSDDVMDMVASFDQEAHPPSRRSTVASDLLGFDAATRVRVIDILMEQHREALAALAGIRDDAVRELAEGSSVINAAATLGVSRQAIYRILQEQRDRQGPRFTNTVFVDERIDLDGRSFQGCTFQQCELVYSGIAPLTLMDSAVNDCRWSFEGAAALTLDFMRALYMNGDAGGRAVVEQTVHVVIGHDPVHDDS
jgi:hypothetical protein